MNDNDYGNKKLSEIDRGNFLQRLRSLQRLCSSSSNDNTNTNDGTLSSILIIAGQDGRHNKGSMQIVKYLFNGSISKDLIDGNLDAKYDCLEEIVLLIQDTSISVIWTNEMKSVIGHLLETCPMVIEYLSSTFEENDVDLLQNRKYCDFKRMILESVQQGSGIGIPIPIGYDNNYDIESWPLLQSFALDQVCNCATGFLTARYNIFDISEYLEILFRTIDGYYVDSAIDIMKRNILPQMMQTIGILNTLTADQRSRLTADDVIGPLDMLFEFGSMDCPFPPDPSCRPIALFASDTSILGTVAINKHAWQDIVALDSTHVVIEGSEPSCGMRWCRTYLLQKGKFLDAINADSLVDDSMESVETIHADARLFASNHMVMCRLEAVYVKLWLALQLAVKVAFSIHRDVLEAGSYVQNSMDVIMKGKQIEMAGVDSSIISVLGLDAVSLIGKERLQVHMDCMDAFGRIVSIEDVDDMGGLCYTYIRVSVVGMLAAEGQEYAVAVGDTFIFSPSLASSPVGHQHHLHPSSASYSGNVHCLTHPLPYYRCFIGRGAEEKSAERTLACTRSVHMLPTLGLGRVVDTVGSGLLSFDMITDHPLFPSVSTDIRLFTDGFVIERIDVACLPVIVSMHVHVEAMWTISAAEFSRESLKLVEWFGPMLSEPDGLIVAFRLKGNEAHSRSTQANDFDVLGVDVEKMYNRYNMLDRALPNLSFEPRLVAFFVRSGSRGAATMLSTCREWRVALRLHDVSEKKGASSVPRALLSSFRRAMDVWNCSGVYSALLDGSSSSSSMASSEGVIHMLDYLVKPQGHGLPPQDRDMLPCGFFPLKCMHMLAEYRRLWPSTGSSSLHYPVYRPRRPMVVVLGHPGSGVLHIGSQLVARLGRRLGGRVAVQGCVVDMVYSHHLDGESLQRLVALSLGTGGDRGKVANCIVATVVLSPLTYYPIADIINCLSLEGDAFPVQVLSTVSSSSIAPSTINCNGEGVGLETWRASVMSSLHSSACSVVLVVEDTSRQKGVLTDAGLDAINPTAEVYQLTPMSMRVDEEVIEALEERVEAFAVRKEKVTSPTDPLVLLRGGLYGLSKEDATTTTTTPHCRQSQGLGEEGGHGGSLRSLLSFGVENRSRVVVDADADADERGVTGVVWEISHLVLALRTLFPQAAVPPVMSNLWTVPANNTNEKGFRRILQVSSVKLLAKKQYADGRKVFDSSIQNVVRGRSGEVEAIQRGVLSVHGMVRVRNKGSAVDESEGAMRFSSSWVYIEACRGSIKVKANEDPRSRNANSLTVHGVLNKSDAKFIQEMFDCCYVYRLRPIPFLEREDVTEVQLAAIQESCRHVSLPDGWFFDGSGFIDGNSMRGARTRFRPDINEFVDRYLAVKNQEIEEYNSILQQSSTFLN